MVSETVRATLSSSTNQPRVFRFSGQAKVLFVLFVIFLIGAAQAYAAVSGQRLYTLKYDGVDHKDDTAVAVAIGPKNSVYVTGASASDYATVKYSSTGALRWVQRYVGPNAKALSAPSALAVDTRGNVYVTGVSVGVDGREGFATVKYGPNGGLRWVKRFSGQSIFGARASDIVIGTTGVYVTGISQGFIVIKGRFISQGIQNESYLVTIKYGFNGRKRWIRRRRWSGTDWGVPAKIALGANDNVYVTGGGIDYNLTIKYDAVGHRLWAKKYSGLDWPAKIAVDKAGNAYVAGAGWATVSYINDDYVLVKYDTNGNRQWVRKYDGPAHSYDEAEAVETDADGNIFVTGTSYDNTAGPSIPNSVTIKYNPAGARQWLQRSTYLEMPAAMALDKNGNVLIAGEGMGLIFTTLKYDTNGNLLWLQFPKKAGNTSMAGDIAVDGRGAAYVTGSGTGRSGKSDFLTVKYAP